MVLCVEVIPKASSHSTNVPPKHKLYIPIFQAHTHTPSLLTLQEITQRVRSLVLAAYLDKPFHREQEEPPHLTDFLPIRQIAVKRPAHQAHAQKQ